MISFFSILITENQMGKETLSTSLRSFFVLLYANNIVYIVLYYGFNMPVKIRIIWYEYYISTVLVVY